MPREVARRTPAQRVRVHTPETVASRAPLEARQMAGCRRRVAVMQQRARLQRALTAVRAAAAEALGTQPHPASVVRVRTQEPAVLLEQAQRMVDLLARAEPAAEAEAQARRALTAVRRNAWPLACCKVSVEIGC